MDSKPLTVGVSDLDVDELKRIVARLEDQDNLCTRDVAFHVQQRVRLYGIDPEYTENVAWMQDGEEIDPDLWERLDEAERNGETGIGVVQYRRLEAQLRDAEARVREMEAFKVRVMAWASERCICGLVGKACPKGMFDGEAKWATFGPCSNWTPPQAWEVGE